MSEQSNPSTSPDTESLGEGRAPLAPDLEAALRDAQAHAEVLEDQKTNPEDQAAEDHHDDVIVGEVVESDVSDPEVADEAEGDTQEIEAVRVELQQAQKQSVEMRDAMLRARADLENARRRFEREKKEDQLFAGERVLKALIPVVDDLDRALANIPETEDTSGSLVEGVQMVHRKFLQALESQGAKSFYPAGELFDPTTHEALMEMPVDDVEPGHIAQVFQRGWLLNERLLRPAKVIIAKEP